MLFGETAEHVRFETYLL